MDRRGRSRRSPAKLLGLACAIGIAEAFCVSALAQGQPLPTPKAVIYPGDIITDDRLMDADIDSDSDGMVIVRTQAIGKVAGRTLLPGRAIPMAALATPRLVKNGGAVHLVFREGALEIVASGSALQDGALGELVKARNDDSGVTVVGSVQADGSLLVDGVR